MPYMGEKLLAVALIAGAGIVGKEAYHLATYSEPAPWERKNPLIKPASEKCHFRHHTPQATKADLHIKYCEDGTATIEGYFRTQIYDMTYVKAEFAPSASKFTCSDCTHQILPMNIWQVTEDTKQYQYLLPAKYNTPYYGETFIVSSDGTAQITDHVHDFPHHVHFVPKEDLEKLQAVR